MAEVVQGIQRAPARFARISDMPFQSAISYGPPILKGT